MVVEGCVTRTEHIKREFGSVVTANEDEFHEICCEGAEIDEVK